MLTTAMPVPLAAADALFGRRRLLDGLQRLLHPDTRNRVIVLHGPAGAGKSAVAGVLAAAWRADGGRVVSMAAAANPEPTGPRRLVVIELRTLPTAAEWGAVLRGLRAEDRLLITARTPVVLPVDDSRLVEVPVAALSWDDSVALLTREGVAPEDRPALVGWAQGLPLLLILGAQAQLQHPEWQPGEEDEPAALTERLARRTGRRDPVAAGRPARAGTDDPVRRGLRAAAEQAVRDYRSPERLAENPLAEGCTPTARSGHLRNAIDEAVGRAFGPSRIDCELLEVLTRGYLVAAGPHESVAGDLYLSRSTYFRRLALALGRVADEVADAVLVERGTDRLAVMA